MKELQLKLRHACMHKPPRTPDLYISVLRSSLVRRTTLLLHAKPTYSPTVMVAGGVQLDWCRRPAFGLHCVGERGDGRVWGRREGRKEGFQHIIKASNEIKSREKAMGSVATRVHLLCMRV